MSSSYKTCAVPLCKSTTSKMPNKLFIHVPKCAKRRKQWITLARRNPNVTSKNATIYFCEDHFDLPNDMQNYMEYRVMGSVRQLRMTPNCLPSKFECQPDRIQIMATRTPIQSRTGPVKRKQRAFKKHNENRLKKQEQCVPLEPIPTVTQDPLSTDAEVPVERALELDDLEAADGAPEVYNYACESCYMEIKRCRYVCAECLYQLCARCHNLPAHVTHYVLRAPERRTRSERKQVLEKLSLVIQEVTSCREEPPEIKLECMEVYEDPLGAVLKEEPPSHDTKFSSSYYSSHTAPGCELLTATPLTNALPAKNKVNPESRDESKFKTAVKRKKLGYIGAEQPPQLSGKTGYVDLKGRLNNIKRDSEEEFREEDPSIASVARSSGTEVVPSPCLPSPSRQTSNRDDSGDNLSNKTSALIRVEVPAPAAPRAALVEVKLEALE